MPDPYESLTRVAVFYDGNFFSHVSNYYTYSHQRRAALSIGGLHEFITSQVALQEEVDEESVVLSEAHYFRGLLTSREQESRSALLTERLLDDALIREGVVAHSLPVAPENDKGVDMWMALEIYEMVNYRRFNVIVLVTSDGEFIPLLRKLRDTGVRSMVLGWDFRFVGQDGKGHETVTSTRLLEEATYPILMSETIEDPEHAADGTVDSLFLSRDESRTSVFTNQAIIREPGAVVAVGMIKNLQDGYGFIAPEDGGADLFFYHTDLQDMDFNDLAIGQEVSFEPGRNLRGPCARAVGREYVTV